MVKRTHAANVEKPLGLPEIDNLKNDIHSFAAYYLIRKKIKSNFFHANYFSNIGKKETSKKEPAKKGVAPQPKSGNYLGLLSFILFIMTVLLVIGRSIF